MKWSGNLILFLLLFIGCNSNDISLIEYRNAEDIQILPKVESLDIYKGYFELNENSIIIIESDSLINEATFLKGRIEMNVDFIIEIISMNKIDLKDQSNYILIENDHSFNNPEAYDLNIDSNSIKIFANDSKGIWYGIQTLNQLFTDSFYSDEVRSNWYLPLVKIADKPHFKHRGLLLDCSRHFFGVNTVKKYIDLLSFYKMNVLHWHLTEDQGWRIEIDAYPKLTEIGAYRTEANGEIYGGFYSKDQIRDIVKYASKRHVTIIPEIELPGHSQAAIAAYPELSCKGQAVEVANDWGVFKEVYCAGNDSVFTFLETVLTEVMDLFPSKYIHIGGDEAPKYRWEHCNKCQKRIQDHGLKDEHALQSYFISRIDSFLSDNGRTLIGWDEILEGGLSPNAVLQSWRGMEGGILAANTNHEAIMSPTSHAYFDYDLKAIDLEKVYSFDPIPEDLDSSKYEYIIGGECNMWTEHVPNDSVLDSKVFPRLLAMSEVLWSYPKERHYESFYNKVQKHYPFLAYFNVKYGEENLPAKINVEVVNKQSIISLEPGNIDINLFYKWDCDTCKTYMEVKDDLILSHSGSLSIKAMKSQLNYGGIITQPFEFHQAIGQKITYLNNFNAWYPAGGNGGLLDSKLGTIDFRDGNWQGFWGQDIEVIIEFDRIKNVNALSTRFYQYSNSWIFIPNEVVFEGSIDGIIYNELGKLHPKAKLETRGKFIEEVSLTLNNQPVKYLKLKVNNVGPVPDWHEAAGADSWLFIDEISVK